MTARLGKPPLTDGQHHASLRQQSLHSGDSRNTSAIHVTESERHLEDSGVVRGAYSPETRTIAQVVRYPQRLFDGRNDTSSKPSGATGRNRTGTPEGSEF